MGKRTKLNEINLEIQTKVKDLKLPKDVSFATGGASDVQTEQFTELFKVMLVSIGVVYLIMVMTFKTLRAPLAILVTLPLATIGAVGGLFLAQMSIDIGAMIGALVLIGIVVTNAIVLIDRVKQNEEHMEIREALLEAGSTRMRPILMTAIATICYDPATLCKRSNGKPSVKRTSSSCYRRLNHSHRTNSDYHSNRL
ncbi:AcrB/AcrD/AcrF family protein [Baia soyae]|uniref:AcrB/AcrD/AcrF family protein n=1 Tax=Baia soyae TaxID=1544746 RepID=A0A4R2RQ15_9BACL|nr:AcrB/AcrD/AcrF family protein [Baia soyae]